MQVVTRLEKRLKNELQESLRKKLHDVISELGYKSIAEHVLFNDRVEKQLDLLCKLLGHNTKHYDVKTRERVTDESTRRYESYFVKAIELIQELKQKYIDYSS